MTEENKSLMSAEIAGRKRRETHFIRRVILIALLTILSLALLAACGDASDEPSVSSGNSSGSSSSIETVEPSSDDSSTETSDHEDETDGDLYTLDQGSFILIDSWDKYDPQSTDAKPFFVPEDYDGVGIPDNISVEYGTNKYSKDDTAAFGEAIMAQLAQQTGGILTGDVTASGITSDKGESVLVFSFSVEDRQITQYYICGDYEHILIYETNFSGSSECDEAAQTIMNTFEWTNRD